jgi:hypothetical protein
MSLKPEVPARLLSYRKNYQQVCEIVLGGLAEGTL